MAINGALKILVLKILSDNEGDGLSIRNSIYSRVKWKVSPGSFYPLMSELVSLKFVEFKKNGRSKTYFITRSGKSFLKNAKKKREDLLKKIDEAVGILSVIGEEKFALHIKKNFDEQMEKLLPIHDELIHFSRTIENLNVRNNLDEIKKILNMTTRKLEAIK